MQNRWGHPLEVGRRGQLKFVSDPELKTVKVPKYLVPQCLVRIANFINRPLCAPWQPSKCLIGMNVQHSTAKLCHVSFL